MKDLVPLIVVAGLLAPGDLACAQDFAAAPGKTRVTLYFDGASLEKRPNPPLEDHADHRLERLQAPQDMQARPASGIPASGLAMDETRRTVRYMTADEWARHPSNRARSALAE
ncbi:MAG: hypothetical protein AAF829_02130 [Pseudomonadota bacterium]